MKDWSHTATLQLLENWRRCGVKRIPKSDAEGVADACRWLEHLWVGVGVDVSSPNARLESQESTDSLPGPILTPDPITVLSSQRSVGSEFRSVSPASEVPVTVRSPALTTAAQVLVGSADSHGWSGSRLDASSRENRFKILAQDAAACRKCTDIVCSRKQTVFGVGPVHAKLVMFGEAPGAEEDRLGQPFVGPAGQLMDKILVASGLRREDVYIMNALKCRPPNNRTPTEAEIENCRPFFEAQLETIQPEFIICWGAVAVRAVLKSTESVGRLRGRFHRYKGAKVLVTYHPSYLLRNPDAKRLTWEDMKFLMKELGIPIPTSKKS